MSELTVGGWTPAERVLRSLVRAHARGGGWFVPEYGGHSGTVIRGAWADPGEAEAEAGDAEASMPVGTDVGLSVAGPLPVAELSEDGLLDWIQDRSRGVSAVQADLLEAVGEFAARRTGSSMMELVGGKARPGFPVSMQARAVADELSCELRLSRVHAERLVEVAVGMRMEAGETWRMLRSGEIDLPKAEAILGLVQGLLWETRKEDLGGRDPREVAAELEKRLLKRAPSQKLAGVQRSGRTQLNNIDPKAAERRHARKKEQRRIRLVPLEDSVCELTAVLPADQALKALKALSALAEVALGEDDPRTLDQARADVLVDVLLNALRALNASAVRCHCEHANHQDGARATNAQHPDFAEGDEGFFDDEGIEEITLTDPTAAGHGTDDVTAPEETTTAAGMDDAATGTDDVAVGVRAADGAGAQSGDSETQFGSGAGCPGERIPSGRRSPGNHEPASGGRASGTHASGTRASGTHPSGTRAANTQAANTRASGGIRGHRRRLRRSKAQIQADAQILITISLETLLGLNDNAAYLEGYGPIVAPMARDIAATGTWRCAIVDGKHGTLDGLGVKTYGPAYPATRRLREFLSRRDKQCRFPGCTGPAQYADVDHVERYPDGVTCECNTELLCRHHHRLNTK